MNRREKTTEVDQFSAIMWLCSISILHYLKDLMWFGANNWSQHYTLTLYYISSNRFKISPNVFSLTSIAPKKSMTYISLVSFSSLPPPLSFRQYLNLSILFRKTFLTCIMDVYYIYHVYYHSRVRKFTKEIQFSKFLYNFRLLSFQPVRV